MTRIPRFTFRRLIIVVGVIAVTLAIRHSNAHSGKRVLSVHVFTRQEPSHD